MSNMFRKSEADRILYEFGLLKKLEELGAPHIIGSYRMDMMVWNDLDIDIENNGMSLDKLYELSSFILNTFHPTWYEAKEETNEEGKIVWFHGFETIQLMELNENGTQGVWKKLVIRFLLVRRYVLQKRTGSILH